MNDFYRIGRLAGRVWRVVRPVLAVAAIAVVAVASYQAGSNYLPRAALTGSPK